VVVHPFRQSRRAHPTKSPGVVGDAPALDALGLVAAVSPVAAFGALALNPVVALNLVVALGPVVDDLALAEDARRYA